MTTTAQQISLLFDNDGTSWFNRSGESICAVCDDLSIDKTQSWDREATRFDFEDGSSIVVLPDGWDHGLSGGCMCWKGVGHDSECMLSGTIAETERQDQIDRFAAIEIGDAPKATENTIAAAIFGQGTADVMAATKRSSFEPERALHDHVLSRAERMRPAREVCQGLIDTIARENRLDVEIPLNCLSLDDGGVLRPSALTQEVAGSIAKNGEIIDGFTFHPEAFRQLSMKAPRRVPSQLRGNLNSWLRDSRSSVKIRSMAQTEVGSLPGISIAFDDQSGRTTRKAFAIVTPKFQTYDADAVVAQFMQAIPAECKAEAVYLGDGGRLQIRAVLPRPRNIAGDIHQIAMSLRTADNGTMSHQGDFDAIRQTCTNGMKIRGTGLSWRVSHLQSSDQVRDLIRQSMTRIEDAVERFAAVWGIATTRSFVCSVTGEALGSEESLRRLVASRTVRVPYLPRKKLFEKLWASHEKEPGDTASAVINAITRTAHEATDWRSPWYQDELEETASDLLFQNVYSISPIGADVREAVWG